MPFRTSYFQHEPKPIAEPVGHVAPVSTEISELLTTSFVDSNNSVAIRYNTDSYLILHQEDIENQLGPVALRKFVDSVRSAAQSSDPVQSSLDKLTDEQLFSVVRNRHIQAPSDVRDSLSEIIDDADKLVAAIQYEQSLRQEEPTLEPSPTE